MSEHVFGEGQPPSEQPAPKTGGLWSRHIRRLRTEKALGVARHIYASRVPSVLHEIAISVETFPDNQWVYTRVETWDRPTALNVLGSHLLDAFDARTTHPLSAPLFDIFEADGTKAHASVPTLSIGDLVTRIGYDTRVEQ